LFVVGRHSTAGQTHQDSAHNQNGRPYPTHEEGGAKRVPENTHHQQVNNNESREIIVAARFRREQSVDLLRPQTSAHAAHASSSGQAVAPLGQDVEAEALHDQVGEGRHARDPTHT